MSGTNQIFHLISVFNWNCKASEAFQFSSNNSEKVTGENAIRFSDFWRPQFTARQFPLPCGFLMKTWLEFFWFYSSSTVNASKYWKGLQLCSELGDATFQHYEMKTGEFRMALTGFDWNSEKFWRIWLKLKWNFGILTVVAVLAADCHDRLKCIMLQIDTAGRKHSFVKIFFAN